MIMLTSPALRCTAGFMIYNIIMAQHKERVLILIDGSNFYNRRKECGTKTHRLTEFNYKRFADSLADKRRIAGRNYYIGAIKTERNNQKGQEMRRKQQQLFAHLRSAKQKFQVILGANKRNGHDYHEKGVDVRMAVDIVAGAYEDKYDTAIIVSSDSDLIPAVKHARKHGKKIEYIGFKHNPTNDLKNNSDHFLLLGKEEMEDCIEEIS